MKEFVLVVLAFYGISAFVFLNANALVWFSHQTDQTQIKSAIALLVIIIDIAALILFFG